MTLDRRNFLKTSFAGAAILTGGSHTVFASCSEKKSIADTSPKAKLNLSFQEGIPPGKNLNEKFDFMEKYGVVGFEPGGRGLAKRVPELKNALKGRNIKISAICAGLRGLFSQPIPPFANNVVIR